MKTKLILFVLTAGATFSSFIACATLPALPNHKDTTLSGKVPARAQPAPSKSTALQVPGTLSHAESEKRANSYAAFAILVGFSKKLNENNTAMRILEMINGFSVDDLPVPATRGLMLLEVEKETFHLSRYEALKEFLINMGADAFTPNLVFYWKEYVAYGIDLEVAHNLLKTAIQLFDTQRPICKTMGQLQLITKVIQAGLPADYYNSGTLKILSNKVFSTLCLFYQQHPHCADVQAQRAVEKHTIFQHIIAYLKEIKTRIEDHAKLLDAKRMKSQHTSAMTDLHSAASLLDKEPNMCNNAPSVLAGDRIEQDGGDKHT